MKISDIKKSNRYRKDYGDIQDLMKSIESVGLIHPIALSQNGKLLAGGRRLTAMIALGMEDLKEGVHYTIIKTDSDIKELDIELCENIKRMDLSWKDEVSLKKDLHSLRQMQNKEHKVEDTANELGISVSSLHSDLSLANSLGEDSIIESKDKFQALSRLKRIKEREFRQKSLSLSGKIPSIGATIIHGDSIEEMRKLKPNSIDMALVDPPFGVDLDKTTGNWLEKYPHIYGSMNDSKENVLKLVELTLIELKRVLKIGSHCWFFFSMTHYVEIFNMISDILGGLQESPAFWIKKSNQNFRPFERLTINYEPMFFCWNFSKLRKFQIPTLATFEIPGVAKKKHPTEKPVDLYKKLIELSTIEGETILDPFGGSGASVEAAILLGRSIIAIEKEIDYVNIMRDRG